MVDNSVKELQKFFEFTNDIFKINLYRPGTTKSIHPKPFFPKFTYPIWTLPALKTEEGIQTEPKEVIVGYSNLSLELSLRTNDLSPVFKIKYKKIRDDVGQVPRTDIKGGLIDYCTDFDFPEEYPTDKVAADWKPPGQVIHSYEFKNRKFEIWQSSLVDPKAVEIFKWAQIFIPLYIEGGVLQDLDDPEWTLQRWKVYFVYEVAPLAGQSDTCPYIFAGFSTSYRLWVIPSFPVMKLAGLLPSPPVSSDGNADASETEETWKPAQHALNKEGTGYAEPYDPLNNPSRERISQFLIIPPYQQQSHGTELYNTMMRQYLADKNVFEITVEDPNERFDDLRDWNDLIRLHRDPDFNKLALPESIPRDRLGRRDAIPLDLLVDQDLVAKLRRRHKLAPRQFARLTELQLLSTIPALHRKPSALRISRRDKAPDANDRRFYFWRLLVKERIYTRNADVLNQIPREEQVEKVCESLNSVMLEYDRLLAELPYREGLANREEIEAAEAKRKGEMRKKRDDARPLIRDEEDEEDEDDEEEDEGKTTTKIDGEALVSRGVKRSHGVDEEANGRTGSKKPRVEDVEDEDE